MVMRLIDPEHPIRWIHPDEREKPKDATVFHIIPLSEGAARKIRAAHPTHITLSGATLSEDEIRHDMFLSQVVRVDNVQWPGAAVLVSITEKADLERFFDSMPSEYGSALRDAIQNTASLDEGDAKNFGDSSG